MSRDIAKDVVAIQALAEKLRRFPRVKDIAVQRSIPDDDIATEAADSLIDIRRSADLIASDLLPRLLGQEPESEVFSDTLDDIVEELRHVYYHISHTRLFDYIVS